MYRKTLIPIVVAPIVGALAATALTGAPAVAGPTITVSPGHSIQAALNKARPGATVVVKRGHYRESLTITKAVTLMARHGVVLSPPMAAPHNLCTLDPEAHGAAPGICVAGTPVDPSNESAGLARMAHDVHLSGFTVSGFGLAAVEVYGARRVTVDRLIAQHNGAGVFAAASRNITITHLVARHNRGNAVNMQEHVSGFSVRHSTIAGNHGEGVFVGSSDHGVIADNRITRNCSGILLVDLGFPGDHGISRIRVLRNTVDANNRFCASDGDAPSMRGNGIVLVGTQHSTVRHNHVRHNTHGSAQVHFGGVALVDAGRLTGGKAPVGNRIDHNVIRHNAPRNLTYDRSGHGNTFGHNRISG